MDGRKQQKAAAGPVVSSAVARQPALERPGVEHCSTPVPLKINVLWPLFIPFSSDRTLIASTSSDEHLKSCRGVPQGPAGRCAAFKGHVERLVPFKVTVPETIDLERERARRRKTILLLSSFACSLSGNRKFQGKNPNKCAL